MCSFPFQRDCNNGDDLNNFSSEKSNKPFGSLFTTAAFKNAALDTQMIASCLDGETRQKDSVSINCGRLTGNDGCSTGGASTTPSVNTNTARAQTRFVKSWIKKKTNRDNVCSLVWIVVERTTSRVFSNWRSRSLLDKHTFYKFVCSNQLRLNTTNDIDEFLI